MKRLLINLAYFLRSKSSLKYFVCTIFLSAFFFGIGAILYKLYHEDIFETIFATAFGFSLSNILIFAVGSFGRMFEDSIKVNTDTAELLRIYPVPEYRKTVAFAGSEALICYHPLIVHRDGFRYQVADDSEKTFAPEGFFEENLTALFDTHSSSKKSNDTTIRLDDVQKNGDVYTLCLSRSTFFNHLITNRAIDFQITKDLSIRSFYEYGPEISPLRKSKLSNHIGINALVYLEDGSVLLQQRDKTATISKNCLTASIATRLTFPDNRPCTITESYLMKDCIYDYLRIRLSIDLSVIPKENIVITFLGLGQNIYEGGKPQMYFRVDLKGVTGDTYADILLRKNGKQTVIDADKQTHIVKADSIKACKGSSFTVCSCLPGKKKYRKRHFIFERSLICNFWHIRQQEPADPAKA